MLHCLSLYFLIVSVLLSYVAYDFCCFQLTVVTVRLMLCVHLCVSLKRWCIVDKRLNGSSWFLV